jgi:UDP-N-acetylglucosamine acyltransferase
VTAGERRLVQDAHRLLYRAGLTTRRAVERIRVELPPSPLMTELLRFIDGSRRGICRGAGRDDAAADEAAAYDEREQVT